jgi:glycosyltransferase involved in cell wall biosynthesis
MRSTWSASVASVRNHPAVRTNCRTAGPPPPAEPVIVVGPISSATGLGEGARLCMRALRAQGLDVRGFDVSSVVLGGDPVEPEDLGAPIETGPGTVILHVTAPLAPLALLMLGRAAVKSKRIIGYFAWELPELTADWVVALDHVHEIWVPSRFNAEAFRRRTGRPVHIVAHPVASPGRLRHFANTAFGAVAPFTVLTPFNMASGFTRKNPVAAVRAFKLAFGPGQPAADHTRMILKTHHVSSYPAGCRELVAAIDGDPRIDISDRTLVRSELNALIASSDTVMLLHRSEGFGLPLAEAMGHGVPVIASNWSGNTDFMNFDNSCPVTYSLVPVHDPQENYDHADQVWAEPSVVDAARHLRSLADSAERRVELGTAAIATIRRRCSIDTYAETIRSLLTGS